MEEKEEAQILTETGDTKYKHFKTKCSHTDFRQRQFLVALQSLQYKVTVISLPPGSTEDAYTSQPTCNKYTQ
jgi:hypothetical protein